MIRIKKIYRLSQLLVWGLVVILSSCSQDELPTPFENGDSGKDKTNLPEIDNDSFVISYSLGDENISRVNGQPHKSTIQSLHYYVYNYEDGTLVKKRKIRGISKDITWPLNNNREDMSWELRQDLQDTLVDNTKYRILFIANADPSLFNKIDKNGQKVNQQLIIKDDNYKTAQLVLPQEAFNEDNMYFMWEGLLDRTNSTTSGKTIKRDDIILRRVVTRIDFERKISLSATDAENEDAVLYRAVQEGLYKQWINNGTNIHVDEDAINKKMQQFEKLIKDEVVNVNIHIPAYPYQGKNGKAQEFINFLQTNRGLLTPIVKDLLTKRYVKQIKGNAKWINSLWKGYKLVKVQFVANTLMTHIGFDRTVSHSPEYGDSKMFPIDGNGCFSIIGFGQKSSNNIESLHFYKTGGTEENTVRGVAFNNTLNQEKNSKYQVYCNPVGTKIECGNVKNEFSLNIDLDLIFRNNPTTKDQWDKFSKYSETCTDQNYNLPFFDYLYKYVFIKNNNNQGFGTNFKDFIIKFDSSAKDYNNTIPDLSSSGAAITFFPSWMIPK